MYEIKKGILYKNGKKIYALGESYYPSFHPSKFPVSPEGDRIGEMKKDLRMMSELGFNHVRFAALGEVALDAEGNVSVSTPFIDAMIREAEQNGLSVSVRQQGYAVNFRGFDDVEMIDWNGQKQETRWSDFIRTTLHHEGILEDNRTYAAALAKHYQVFDNVVAYQIYNEPHYPSDQIYDYHPDTLKSYRKWLTEKGIMSEDESESYEPPRSRSEQTPRMWALWRIFSRDSLTDFLDNASDASKTGFDLPTYTCFTGDQTATRNVYRGCDLFANAKSMDIVGYTTYIHAKGADYYAMCHEADLAQCAAELEGKQSWCIELDSRTYIPTDVYNRGTYTIIGSGCKGIVYYQWRGDCPVPGVPHPNSCGLLNYDGTKTHNFDNGAAVNRYIINMNNLLMDAHRVHEGIGLLHSDYAAFLCDAKENGDKEKRHDKQRNSYLAEYTETYRQLREAGYSVSLTDTEHLYENPFGIKLLFVPYPQMLSPEEQSAVEHFIFGGGEVYEIAYTACATACIGFKKYEKRTKSYEEVQFDQAHRPCDVGEMMGIIPYAIPIGRDIGVQRLSTDECELLVITNISTVKSRVDAEIQINAPIKSAEFIGIDGQKNVRMDNGRITVDGVTDGGILIVR